MAILGFAGKAKAEAWVDRVIELNDRTERLLQNVGMCLEDIGQDGQGSAIDSLISAGTELLNSAAIMVTSFKSMADTITSIIGSIIDAIAGNDSIIGAVVNTIGRLGN